MNILQINKFHYIKGGSEVYMFALSDELREKNHNIVPFSMKHKKNRITKWDNHFVDLIDYEDQGIAKKFKNAIGIIYSFEAQRKLSSLLSEFKPDIAHLHVFQHQLSASILPVLKRHGIPIVYTAHDLKSICPNYKMFSHGNVCERCEGNKYYHCLIRKCTKNSYSKSLINVLEMYFHKIMKWYDLIDLIIAPSEFYRNKLVEYRFSEQKVVHIPNFVDLKKYNAIDDFQNYCLYFGRLSEEKGLLTLIESMKYLNHGKCVIVGDGPMKAVLENKIEKLNLNNIKLIGFKSGHELLSIIQHSMFTILPSEWYENCPMALLESFACGKPVLGSDMGGIPEHITDGEDGHIFKAGDPKDLANKLNQFFMNPEKIKIMGKSARKKAETLYSIDRHLDKIIVQYEKVIRSYHRQRSNHFYQS